MPNKTHTDIELPIARKLIETSLARGLRISVNDGEETTVLRSTDLDEIMGALASTDADWLYLYSDVPHRLGSIFLVWGNGTDIIADHITPNAECAALMDELCDIASKFGEELAYG